MRGARRLVAARGRSLLGRRAAQQVRPAALARAGQACELHHQCAGRALGQLVEEALDRGDVGEVVHAVAGDAQLARGLRAAQHQHSEQDHRLRGNAQHAVDVVLVAPGAAAAGLGHQAVALEAVDRSLHLRLAELEHRVATGLLVAARHQRVERQRIAVGHGALLFGQHAEDAGFDKGQDGQRSGHGSAGKRRGTGFRAKRPRVWARARARSRCARARSNAGPRRCRRDRARRGSAARRGNRARTRGSSRASR